MRRRYAPFSRQAGSEKRPSLAGGWMSERPATMPARPRATSPALAESRPEALPARLSQAPTAPARSFASIPTNGLAPRMASTARSPMSLRGSISPGPSSREGAEPGNGAADDQALHGLRPLVRVQALHVRVVTHDVALQQDAVAAQQVPRLVDDGPRRAGVVQLRERGHRAGQPPLRRQVPEPQAVELHRGQLGQHPGQAVLDDLEARELAAELPALRRVRDGRLVGRGGLAERAPGARGPRPPEHLADVPERPGAGQAVLQRDADVLHDDVGLPDGPQRALPGDRPGGHAGA